jgi:peptidoglycan-N-acetylglucosamine deacetylase
MSQVALSFDNGPHPEATPKVLEVLQHYGVLATFFVIGKNVAARDGPTLIGRARAEGHWIGNHTYSHNMPLGRIADPAVAIAEIEMTQALIGNCAQERRLFRPYGEGGNLDNRLLSRPVIQHLQDRRYDCVIWNVVPGDWLEPDGWVDTALARIEATSQALIVLHDIPAASPAKLSEFIERCLDCGHSISQDFPASCVLIRNGAIVQPLDHLAPAG